MVPQSNDPQRSWYDAIMRSQYYDELIPAYEALQERIGADYDVSPVCGGLVKGGTRLLRLARRSVAGFWQRAHRAGAWHRMALPEEIAPPHRT
jgi:hypothetical protein